MFDQLSVRLVRPQHLSNVDFFINHHRSPRYYPKMDVLCILSIFPITLYFLVIRLIWIVNLDCFYSVFSKEYVMLTQHNQIKHCCLMSLQLVWVNVTLESIQWKHLLNWEFFFLVSCRLISKRVWWDLIRS